MFLKKYKYHAFFIHVTVRFIQTIKYKKNTRKKWHKHHFYFYHKTNTLLLNLFNNFDRSTD